MIKNLYNYKAKILSVYDGDTVRANVDLGMKTAIFNEKCRLARINAPEMRGQDKAKGKLSRDFLRNKILNKNVILETKKDKKGKYGRYIVEIWIEEENEFINVNDLLVSEGFAEYKEY